MLSGAMQSLLGPLFEPASIRFARLPSPLAVGSFKVPVDVEFPVDLQALPSVAAGSAKPADLASGAMYVLCYQPLHPGAGIYADLARAYVATYDPEFVLSLLSASEQALSEGDWVGTIGRIWTAVQLEPASPETLCRLAEACFQFGYAAARRADGRLSARMARACAAATNALLEEFPDYAPGYLRRADVLRAFGDRSGALRSVKEAVRKGLPPGKLDEARLLLQELSDLSALP